MQPGTELVFSEGHNVLLGVNGSGKTTLLKLIAKVCSGVFEGLVRTDFHVEYEIEHAGVSYSVDLQYERPAPTQASELAVTLDIKRPDDEPIRIELKEHKAIVRYRECSAALAELASPFIYPLITTATLSIFNTASHDVGIKKAKDLVGVDYRPVSRLDESTQWLDESLRLGTFDIYEMKPHSRRSAGMRTPSCVMDGAVAKFDSGGGRDNLLFTHDELDFLKESVAGLGVVGASMRLDTVSVTQRRSGFRDGSTYTYGRYEFRFIKRGGARLRPEDLSFGQQRFFAFLYYAAMHPDIVIADELTNGMHHSMIERCLDFVEGRQTFLATQNPLLLDNLKGFQDAEDVRRTFILCSVTEDDDGQEWMTWRNMTRDEAENFYRDYKVGISHVNDILRSWGLW
ncbi:MAG TPA: ATP-binding protein [Nannocystis sp.]